MTYTYWEWKFDEWISNIQERVAPVHTHTYSAAKGHLEVGQRLEVLDECQKWLEAFVTDLDNNKV